MLKVRWQFIDQTGCSDLYKSKQIALWFTSTPSLYCDSLAQILDDQLDTGYTTTMTAEEEGKQAEEEATKRQCCLSS